MSTEEIQERISSPASRAIPTIMSEDEDGDAKSSSPDRYQSDSDEEDDLDGAEQPIR